MNGTTILTQRARLRGGKAYDSDPHDQILLNKYEIELIAPHRKNRKKAKIQNGCKLRPYKRRWKVGNCSKFGGKNAFSGKSVLILLGCWGVSVKFPTKF